MADDNLISRSPASIASAAASVWSTEELVTKVVARMKLLKKLLVS